MSGSLKLQQFPSADILRPYLPCAYHCASENEHRRSPKATRDKDGELPRCPSPRMRATGLPKSSKRLPAEQIESSFEARPIRAFGSVSQSRHHSYLQHIGCESTLEYHTRLLLLQSLWCSRRSTLIYFCFILIPLNFKLKPSSWNNSDSTYNTYRAFKRPA